MPAEKAGKRQNLLTKRQYRAKIFLYVMGFSVGNKDICCNVCLRQRGEILQIKNVRDYYETNHQSTLF